MDNSNKTIHNSQKDLTGLKVGSLEVLYRDKEKQNYWVCKCECGNIKSIFYTNLANGKIKSCGCNIQKRRELDQEEIGKTYGKWTILKPISDRGPRKFLARCECGTEKIVNINSLKYGNSKSCGCERSNENSIKYKDKLIEYRKESQKKYRYKGTMITSLNQKISKNNSTGYKGVSKLKNGEYRAYIYFKGKQKHLGLFNTLEEAYAARKKAEDIYFKPLIKEWENK